MLSRDAEAFSIAWSKLKIELSILGRDVFLDPDNAAAFNEAVNAEPNGVWASRQSDLDAKLFKMKRCFVNGFLADRDQTFEESFELAAKFLAMIDSEIAKV